jgi:hypothetical protein
VADGVRWVAFTSTLDVIVPGRRAVPGRGGVRTVTVDDHGHLGMLLSRQVVSRILAELADHSTGKPARERDETAA